MHCPAEHRRRQQLELRDLERVLCGLLLEEGERLQPVPCLVQLDGSRCEVAVERDDEHKHH